MKANMLKLNGDKTEIMLFHPRHKEPSSGTISINVEGCVVTPKDKVRNLGVLFDTTMNMKHQVNSVCRAGYNHLRNIAHIRRYLTVDSLVTSQLDYCNSLLVGLPNTLLNKLQQVQNTAARMITRTPRNHHITPVLNELHWLPTKS